MELNLNLPPMSAQEIPATDTSSAMQSEQPSSQSDAAAVQTIETDDAELVQKDIGEGEKVLDTASLAAQSIAEIAGMKDPEAIAQAVLFLTSRVASIEAILPQLLAVKDSAEAALKLVEDTLPPDFKNKMQVWADDVSKVVAHVKKHFSLTF